MKAMKKLHQQLIDYPTDKLYASFIAMGRILLDLILGYPLDKNRLDLVETFYIQQGTPINVAQMQLLSQGIRKKDPILLKRVKTELQQHKKQKPKGISLLFINRLLIINQHFLKRF